MSHHVSVEVRPPDVVTAGARSRSFRSTLARAFVAPLAFTATLVAGYPIVQAIEPERAMPTSQRALDRPAAPGSPRALIEEHGCWNGPAPADMAGKVPGHVVVTRTDAIAPTYAGPRMVDKALGQVFAGEDRGLVVHAFCR